MPQHDEGKYSQFFTCHSNNLYQGKGLFGNSSMISLSQIFKAAWHVGFPGQSRNSQHRYLLRVVGCIQAPKPKRALVVLAILLLGECHSRPMMKVNTPNSSLVTPITSTRAKSCLVIPRSNGTIHHILPQYVGLLYIHKPSAFLDSVHFMCS